MTETLRRWRAKNREKLNAINKKWREKNKDWLGDYYREYREKHKYRIKLNKIRREQKKDKS